MQLTEALTEFMLAHDYQPATVRTYQKRLGAFLRWCERQEPTITTVGGITASLVRRFMDEQRTIPSPTTGRLRDSHTLNSHARSVLAFLNWLVLEGELEASIPKRIKPPRREQKVLRVLDKRQVDRLFLAAATGPTATRDTAILAVLLDTGLRANELCTLDRRDVTITPDDGHILVRHGKGRRQREVPLGRKSRLALAKYLRSHQADAVFLGHSTSPLTPSGVDQALYKLYDRAGRKYFEGLKLGAHLFRHTFASNYMRAGGSIYHLSRLMGHSQVGTTEGYLTSLTARQIREGALSPLDLLGA